MPGKDTVAERITDSIPRVDNAVAVGEDLDFQRQWWRFEKAAWVMLALVLIADALGVFGRGWLARAERSSADGNFSVRYERVERAGTPSVMTITVNEGAQQNRQLQLFASESVVEVLGAQRIIPQPESSTLTPGGLLYTFPMTSAPAEVSFELEPSFPGVHTFELRVPGASSVQGKVLVLP